MRWTTSLFGPIGDHVFLKLSIGSLMRLADDLIDLFMFLLLLVDKLLVQLLALVSETVFVIGLKSALLLNMA